ncbi:MAG: peptidylprolyl isomerase [Polyangiales bacterium]
MSAARRRASVFSIFAAVASAAVLAHAQPRTDAAVSPAETARRAQAVARIEGATITVGELEDLLNAAPAPIRQGYLLPEARRRYLEGMVQTLLLAQEARRRGLDRDPQVVTAIRRRLSQRTEQAEILEAITPESITDAEVARHYEQRRGEFQRPELRRATVAIAATREAALAAATELRAAQGDMRRVRSAVTRAGGDAGAPEGDLGYFERTGTPGAVGGGPTVDPRVAAAVFSLQRLMDVTVEPVALADGRYAVAVLTGQRPATNHSLSDPGVVASIRGALLRARRERREQELLRELRTRLRPEVHEERLQLIHLPPSDLGALPALAPPQPAAERTP